MLASTQPARWARTKLPRRRGEAGRCVRQVGVVIRARPRHKRLPHRSRLMAWRAAAGAGDSAREGARLHAHTRTAYPDAGRSRGARPAGRGHSAAAGSRTCRAGSQVGKGAKPGARGGWAWARWQRPQPRRTARPRRPPPAARPGRARRAPTSAPAFGQAFALMLRP